MKLLATNTHFAKTALTVYLRFKCIDTTHVVLNALVTRN